MAVIVKILLLSVAFNGSLCYPLGREEQLRRLFQNNYLKHLKDIVYFPDSPYLIEESSTEKSYISLNKPLTKTIRNPLSKKHQAFTTTQNYGAETKSDENLGCATLNAKECDEYKKLVDDIFHKDDLNVRIKENYNNKIYANNNVDPINSWAYEEERKPIFNNYPKSFNENYITSGQETTGDYETTTDDLSFRVPPPAIVASLLG
ncbi:hypothetical protein evm_009014 [Chilo suppressalis]|nr:hypothetical protein evm_009014 [Chilo suppressalis]